MTTWPGIPDHNVTIYMKKTYKKILSKNFQNFLIVQALFCISIHSKNALHCHDVFLMYQKLGDPVRGKINIESFTAHQDFLK